MTEKQYFKRIQKHHKAFIEVFNKIANDTNAIIESGKNYETLSHDTQSEVESLSDNLVLNGAWIIDRLNGVNSWRDLKPSKSLVKRVRKALGYTG